MEIPFIGPSYSLDSRPSGVQRTVNLIPHPQEPGNERSAWVFKDVPGLVLVSSLESFYILMETGEHILIEDGGAIETEGA